MFAARLKLQVSRPAAPLRLLSCLERRESLAAAWRDAPWTSAVLRIGLACHSGIMGRLQELRRRHAPIKDFYGHAAAPRVMTGDGRSAIG